MNKVSADHSGIANIPRIAAWSTLFAYKWQEVARINEDQTVETATLVNTSATSVNPGGYQLLRWSPANLRYAAQHCKIRSVEQPRTNTADSENGVAILTVKHECYPLWIQEVAIAIGGGQQVQE